MRASGPVRKFLNRVSPAFKICEFPPNRPSVLEFANFGGLFLPLFLSLFEHSFSSPFLSAPFLPILFLALFFNKKPIFIL